MVHGGEHGRCFLVADRNTLWVVSYIQCHFLVSEQETGIMLRLPGSGEHGEENPACTETRKFSLEVSFSCFPLDPGTTTQDPAL